MAQTARRKPRNGRKALSGGRKRVLVVLFVPSVERDGTTAVDQQRWVDASLEMFGRVFGGATAYPKAKGVWRDDERGGALVMDEPVVVHCYTTPAISRTIATSLRSEPSAARWVATRIREKSVSSSATSTSPFASLKRSRR
jgi:hypothetical protein